MGPVDCVAHSDSTQRVCRSNQPKDEAEAWSAWAKGHTQRLNPLDGSPLTPEIPEPRAEGLKSFMHGLSPYGPSY